MLHAGIDMHKESLVISVLDDGGKVVLEPSKIPTDETEIRSFFEGMGPEVRAVLEAGPNWYWLCDLLDEIGIDNRLCHPLKTRAIASARIKTDKLDARVLADLLRTDFIAESYKPPLETRYLRELMRGRSYLVNLRTSAKNRAHNILSKRNIKHEFSDLFCKKGMEFLHELELPDVYRHSLDSCLNVIELLSEEIKACEARANCALEESRQAQLLSTIPGVGLITSLMIVAEIGAQVGAGGIDTACGIQAGAAPGLLSVKGSAEGQGDSQGGHGQEALHLRLPHAQRGPGLHGSAHRERTAIRGEPVRAPGVTPRLTLIGHPRVRIRHIVPTKHVEMSEQASLSS